VYRVPNPYFCHILKINFFFSSYMLKCLIPLWIVVHSKWSWKKYENFISGNFKNLLISRGSNH
jgi:hypothetical protein